MKNELLAQSDVNVIVLDWRQDASNAIYLPSARNVVGVGRALANFLNFLLDTSGSNWNNVHIIGHSLGAHVAGNAGRSGRQRPSRVTG